MTGQAKTKNTGAVRFMCLLPILPSQSIMSTTTTATVINNLDQQLLRYTMLAFPQKQPLYQRCQKLLTDEMNTCRLENLAMMKKYFRQTRNSNNITNER